MILCYLQNETNPCTSQTSPCRANDPLKQNTCPVNSCGLIDWIYSISLLCLMFHPLSFSHVFVSPSFSLSLSLHQNHPMIQLVNSLGVWAPGVDSSFSNNRIHPDTLRYPYRLLRFHVFHVRFAVYPPETQPLQSANKTYPIFLKPSFFMNFQG